MAPSKGAALRRRIAANGLVVCPGVTNPLHARMAEEVGFRAVFVTGSGVANAEFGVPDLGLVTMTEMLEVCRRIAASVMIPAIVDIDTGYGGALNVMRTVAEFEAAGVAAVLLEDQVNPKRCGYFSGKQLVSAQEMVERVIAAGEARTDPGLLIIARTDAIAVEGFRAAIQRAHTYVEAGADAVFVAAAQSLEELRAIPREFEVPAVANMVEAGKMPLVPGAELAEMGYALVLYADAVFRAATAAALRALRTIHGTGSSAALQVEMLGWEERQSLVRLPEFQTREDGIVERARSVLSRVSHPAEDAGGGRDRRRTRRM